MRGVLFYKNLYSKREMLLTLQLSEEDLADIRSKAYSFHFSQHKNPRDTCIPGILS